VAERSVKVVSQWLDLSIDLGAIEAFGPSPGLDFTKGFKGTCHRQQTFEGAG